VVLCGRGVARPPDGIPCLPPVPDAAGPLAAALAAVRWAPRHAWLVVDPAFPGVERRLIEDLPARRRPGVWAIAAAGGPGAAPGLPLLIEPPAANLLESGRRRGIDDPVAILADHPRFLSLAAPPGATPERGAAPGC